MKSYMFATVAALSLLSGAAYAQTPLLEARIKALEDRLQNLQSTMVSKEEAGRLGLEAVMQNPQQVMTAFNLFVQKQQEEIAARGLAIPLEAVNEVHRADVHGQRVTMTFGAESPKMRISVFMDHNCPYCRQAIPLIRKMLERGDTQLFIHEMPILGPQSQEAALVSMAATRLDNAKAAQLYLGEGTLQGRVGKEEMLKRAESLGFHRGALEQEMAKPETQNAVQRALQISRALQINGTPAFVVEDRLFQSADESRLLTFLEARSKGEM